MDMKRIAIILIAMLLSVAMFAQGVPQTVNFSATVRDANNQLLANTQVNVRLTFYEGGEGGTPVYCALHQTTTNDNGFMSFQLNRNVLASACNGAPNTPFEEIPWENGNYWIYVEYQTQIGEPFESLGYLELTSGFYAFSSNYSLIAQKLEGFDLDVTNAHNGDVIVYNGATGKWEARRPNSIGIGGATGSLNGHEYVDLGLPSGTRWATCNVGATTPEEYGEYFAWGETSPKENYEWSTYHWCNGNVSTITKYCSISDDGNDGFTDNLTTLEASDDAATANWGAGWRMPTAAEVEELYVNCNRTWITQNGVYGRLFTGPNGNSIFLPAAGVRVGFDHYGPTAYNEYYGTYWSSSLFGETSNNAVVLGFDSEDDYNWYYSGHRYKGYSVRAVCTSQN